MGLYNFQERFVAYILDGSKTHAGRLPFQGHVIHCKREVRGV